MPIYAYRCTECDTQTEVLQKMGEAPLITCVHCQKASLTKVVTAPRVRLSGQGYYETDEKPKDKQRHIATKDTDPGPAQTSAGQEGV